MAGEVMKGLFGLDPSQMMQDREQAARDREALLAYKIAGMDQMQGATALGMMSGSQVGRGIGDLVKYGAGAIMGKDTRPEDVKVAELLKTMAPDLARISPEDRLSTVAQRLLEEGYSQGVPASQAAYSQRMNDLKMQMEAFQKRAAAVKDLAEAQKAARPERTINPIDASKFSPASVQKFNKSGNFSDLEPVSGYNADLDALFTRWKANPSSLTPSEMGKMVALAKDAWGTDYTNSTFNEQAHRTADQRETDELLKLQFKGQRTPEEEQRMVILRTKLDPAYTKLTDEQSKTLYFDRKSSTALNIAQKRWNDVWDGKKPPPVSINQIKPVINSWFLTNPNQPLSMQMAFNLADLKDPVQQQYLTDMLAIAYPALRKETGAAISQQEWQTVFNLLVPFAGETAEGQKNKIERLKSDVKALKDLARLIPAYDRYNSSASPTASSPTASSPTASVEPTTPSTGPKPGGRTKWKDL